MAGFTEIVINEKVQTFWAALQRGEFITDAASEAGTYRKKGARWMAEWAGTDEEQVTVASTARIRRSLKGPDGGTSSAAGLGDPTQPVAVPVGAVGDVDPGRDASGVQLVEDLGAYSEELFDRQWPVSEQQRLAEATVVGGHRPGRAAFGQAEAEAQKGDIGRFSVGVDAGRLDVCALDQPDVHAGLSQRVRVGMRAQQVRLHRGAEPVGQATCCDVQHAGHDRVAAGGVFGTNLDTPARGQGPRDGG
jgi:hypothetical protein